MVCKNQNAFTWAVLLQSHTWQALCPALLTSAAGVQNDGCDCLQCIHAVQTSSPQVYAALLISTGVQYHYNTRAVFSKMSAVSVVRLEDQRVGLAWCAGLTAATSHNVF